MRVGTLLINCLPHAAVSQETCLERATHAAALENFHYNRAG